MTCGVLDCDRAEPVDLETSDRRTETLALHVVPVLPGDGAGLAAWLKFRHAIRTPEAFAACDRPSRNDSVAIAPVPPRVTTRRVRTRASSSPSAGQKQVVERPAAAPPEVDRTAPSPQIVVAAQGA